MKIIGKIALILLIVGALNWGLIGLFRFNFVSFIFGSMTIISRIVYSLVGLSAVMFLIAFFYDRSVQN